MEPILSGTDTSLRLFLSSGEVSGDVVGGALARALRALRPGVMLRGMGGNCMREAGVSLLCETNHLGSVGITETVRTLPGILDVLRAVRADFRKQLPHAAILIGHDGFHLLLARWLRARGVTVFSLFPPQIWIWRSLAKPIASSYDLIFTSFPEEDEVYREAGGETVYIGHYLTDLLYPSSHRLKRDVRRDLNLAPDASVVALFPGSRLQEIAVHTAVCLDAARLMQQQHPMIQFVLPLVDQSHRDFIRESLRALPRLEKVRVCKDGRNALRACDVAIVCSGTATLEALLMEVPLVIFYQLAPFTRAVSRLLGKFGLLDPTTIGLPNLLAGRRIVPEFHPRVEAAQLSSEALGLLLDSPRRKKMQDQMRRLRCTLAPGGGLRKAASLILEHRSLLQMKSAERRTHLPTSVVKTELSECIPHKNGRRAPASQPFSRARERREHRSGKGTP